MIYRQNVLCWPLCRLDEEMVCAIGLLNVNSTGRDCGEQIGGIPRKISLPATFKVLPDKGLGERWAFYCKNALNLVKNLIQKPQFQFTTHLFQSKGDKITEGEK